MENQGTDTKSIDPIELQRQIDDLKHRLTPDAIAKSIDNSYLSINNLRAFLQILSVIMTIFIAGAIAFGYLGVSNIMKIQEEAKRVGSIRESTESFYNSTKSTYKVVEQTYQNVTEIEKQIGSKIAKLDSSVSDFKKKTDEKLVSSINDLNKKTDEKLASSINGLNKKTDEEMTKLSRKLGDVDKRVEEISKNLHDISETFNKIGVASQNILNAREKQLLALLAKEIDPNNPIFNINAAYWALSFRRYDEAVRYVDLALKTQGMPEEIRSKAKVLRSQAEQMKANPPKLDYTPGKGVTVGPYGVFEFPLNILQALVRNGYLTVQEAQEIIDGSKSK